MMKEFKRAEDIVNTIHAGKKQWSDLFSRHTFFTEDHKYYLSVIAASRTSEAHDSFAGLVQSKVRLLVKGIDDGDAGVDIARPYVKPFDRIHRCENEDQIERVIQGNLDFQLKEGDAVVVPPASNGGATKEPHTIYTTTFYIGLTLPEGTTFLTLLVGLAWLTLHQAVESHSISPSQSLSLNVTLRCRTHMTRKQCQSALSTRAGMLLSHRCPIFRC